eukprot:2197990-Prorocentrum_lima.AAC.1
MIKRPELSASSLSLTQKRLRLTSSPHFSPVQLFSIGRLLLSSERFFSTRRSFSTGCSSG